MYSTSSEGGSSAGQGGDTWSRLRQREPKQIAEYLELIEGYFLSKLPVKAFDENPYRIRIYGAWSIACRQ